MKLYTNLIASVAFVFSVLPSTESYAETVKIAVIVGLSGTNAIYGEGQLNAFNAAAELVNERGGVLGGKKIEIIPLDHKNTPQEALIQLRRAIDENIHYVGSTVSSIVHALSKLPRRKRRGFESLNT